MSSPVCLPSDMPGFLSCLKLALQTRQRKRNEISFSFHLRCREATLVCAAGPICNPAFYQICSVLHLHFIPLIYVLNSPPWRIVLSWDSLDQTEQKNKIVSGPVCVLPLLKFLLVSEFCCVRPDICFTPPPIFCVSGSQRSTGNTLFAGHGSLFLFLSIREG